eukprot:SAG11_NODE_102_length_16709_cov_31.066093_4_plen_41_part_00
MWWCDTLMVAAITLSGLIGACGIGGGGDGGGLPEEEQRQH